MLIDLTYRCSMGCSHCMSDCRPDGTDMTPEVLEDVLAFYRKHQVPNLTFSGGEMFENPYILDLLQIIEKNWDQKFPLTFITNGRKLSNTPDLLETVQGLQRKYSKKKVIIQITDDSRFYPESLTEKQRYRLKKLDAIIEGVPGSGNRCLYPQGRALENFNESWWNTNAPKCTNVRILPKQGICTIHGIVMTLLQAGKICTPVITPTGEIKLGESALCPSVATIYDSEEKIIENILNCRCQSCQYAFAQLQKNHPGVHAMLSEK